MVHALAPDRSDQTFGKAILPGRGRSDRLVPDGHGTNSPHNYGAIDSIPIPDEVAWSLIPGNASVLARDPFGCRVRRDVDPDKFSAIQADDDEGIEQVEANGRNNEQIHGGNVRRVVPQKGAPPLTWWATSLDHVFGDAGLSHLKPELEQLAMNARRAPKWILDAHPPD